MIENNEFMPDQMTKIAILFIALVFFPIEGKAFQFDIWRSGTSLKEVKTLAKKKRIKLVTLKNSYDVENKSKSNSVQYATRLFDEEVEVTLTFTNSSNLLYKADISWNKLTKVESEMLFHTVSNNLEKKYGVFSPTSGTSLLTRNGERCNGDAIGYSKNIGDDSISLTLSSCFNNLHLNYSNETLSEKQDEEFKNDQKNVNDVNKL